MVCCLFNLFSSRENQKASSVWPLLQGATAGWPEGSEECHYWTHRDSHNITMYIKTFELEEEICFGELLMCPQQKILWRKQPHDS